MISKLIVWGRDRNEAIGRMSRALDELRIDGVMTSVNFHRRLMAHPAFIAAEMHTGFLEEYPELLVEHDDEWLEEIAVIAAAVAHFRRVEERSARGPESAGASGAPSAWKWHGRGGWRR